MTWAKTVPRGVRFDLTASGVADAFTDAAGQPAFVPGPGWSDGLDLASLTRRDAADEALAELGAAVARRYDIDPACVTASIAASSAISQVVMATVRVGDHVIVERPTYEALRRVPEIFGATVSRLERKYDEGWSLVPERLAQLLTSRTRAVILSNLHNPTGVAIDAKTMNAVAELASRVGAMVVVDEVYLDYCFAEPGAAIQPACRVARNCVSWSSTTKGFGASALRCGWIVSPDPDAARAMRAAADYLHVYPPVASARLGARVLGDAEALVARAQAIATAGRAVVDAWLARETRLSWVPPAAGLTGLVRLPSFMSDVPFAEHLRQRYDTQVVPGSMFEAPGFVRLSFGLAPAELEQALANVSAALDDLQAS